MEKKPRYVVCRTIGGKQLWYWQRKGFKTERLPDDADRRRQRADALNMMADRHLIPVPEAGDTVRYVITSYEKSSRYLRLSSGTRAYYDRYMRELLRVFGSLPFRQLSRRVIVEFVKTHRNPGEQHKMRAVLSVLFNHAREIGLIEVNQAEGLNLETPPKRGAVWEQEDIDAFLMACEVHPMGGLVRLYFQICRFTAQRPGDTAAMSWSQYNGDTIKLRQQKTKKLVEVPCHSELRAELDAAQRSSILIFAQPNGEAFNFWNIADWERDIRQAAGLYPRLQIRDLRRTAMVRMAEAGAEITDIAAVSGHTIAATVQILETYIPRTRKMAERAIFAWEHVQKPKRT